MKLKYPFILVLCLGTLLSYTAISKEGVKVSSKTKNLSSNSVTSSDIYIAATEVAVVGKRETLLFNASSNIFTFIDHSKKEYYKLDEATLVQLKAQVKMFAQMMKQFVNQMPEEQRQKLDKILNPGSQPEINYVKASGIEKVLNWSTSRYEGKSGGDKLMSLYIASFNAIGVSKSKFKALEDMMVFVEENLKDLSSLLPAGKSAGWSQLSVGEGSPIMSDGLPVKTLTYENGAAADENTVQEIRLMDVPNDLFTVPSGYVRKRVDIEGQLK